MSVPSVLARICDEKRRHIAQSKERTPLSALMKSVGNLPPPRGFVSGLRQVIARDGAALITEIKKASPSAGLIRPNFDPPSLAQAYEAGGAACLSVLTDTPFFQGRDEDLVAARAACTLPVLRKDFILDPYQVIESRALGADAILLIVAAFTDDRDLINLEALALDLGLDVLVEVHNEKELDRALRLSTPLIGINNRDLKRMYTTLEVTERLAPRVPKNRMIICESGISRRKSIEHMKAVGAQGFLIGESLMKQDDVTQGVKALRGVA